MDGSKELKTRPRQSLPNDKKQQKGQENARNGNKLQETATDIQTKKD